MSKSFKTEYRRSIEETGSEVRILNAIQYRSGSKFPQGPILPGDLLLEASPQANAPRQKPSLNTMERWTLWKGMSSGNTDNRRK